MSRPGPRYDSSITIYLNKKVTSAVKVGWIVLDKQQVTAA